MLASHRFDAWRFSTDKDLLLTHNLAAQAVRMAKVHRQDCRSGFPAGQDAGSSWPYALAYLLGKSKGAHLFDDIVSTFNDQPAPA